MADQEPALVAGIQLLTQWMRTRAHVRIVGYGRARLAVAFPANRLAHAGVPVSVLGDAAPLASTSLGGGLIVASASGRTPEILELLTATRQRAPAIRVLGFSVDDAVEFARHCDVFVGLKLPAGSRRDAPFYFGDELEHVVLQLLDALIAVAVDRAGLSEEDLRSGHEDLGGTGPYTRDFR